MAQKEFEELRAFLAAHNDALLEEARKKYAEVRSRGGGRSRSVQCNEVSGACTAWYAEVRGRGLSYRFTPVSLLLYPQAVAAAQLEFERQCAAIREAWAAEMERVRKHNEAIWPQVGFTGFVYIAVCNTAPHRSSHQKIIRVLASPIVLSLPFILASFLSTGAAGAAGPGRAGARHGIRRAHPLLRQQDAAG